MVIGKAQIDRGHHFIFTTYRYRGWNRYKKITYGVCRNTQKPVFGVIVIQSKRNTPESRI